MAQFVYEKIKFKFLHYIQHDFIRQRLGVRLACSNVLLSINYFIADYEILLTTHSNGYI